MAVPSVGMDDNEALERLRDHLADQGWTVRLADDVLSVANPDADLNDRVICRAGAFRWPWAASPIGPVGDVPGAAARVMHVLRAVAK